MCVSGELPPVYPDIIPHTVEEQLYQPCESNLPDDQNASDLHTSVKSLVFVSGKRFAFYSTKVRQQKNNWLFYSLSSKLMDYYYQFRVDTFFALVYIFIHFIYCLFRF